MMNCDVLPVAQFELWIGILCFRLQQYILIIHNCLNHLNKSIFFLSDEYLIDIYVFDAAWFFLFGWWLASSWLYCVKAKSQF